ncbi:MAG: type II toxin-antitoxin system MqsA family antitoxin [Syntrophobacteraceae bacterium]|nr:type II toxin-antitoxin system MqsA family antitoxin [Syntrophobacteraceae bacterium]
MKCPSCGRANLVRDTRDMPYTYKGEATVITAVTGTSVRSATRRFWA